MSVLSKWQNSDVAWLEIQRAAVILKNPLENNQSPTPVRVKIGGITYDTDTAIKLAHKPTSSSDQQLYQTSSGDFFIFALQACVDGQKLQPHECWIDLGRSVRLNARLSFSESITPLSHHQALEWCIKTQIPTTLRGYFLDSI